MPRSDTCCAGRYWLESRDRPRLALRSGIFDLPLRRTSHIGLLERARALRANITLCDALCVALAERLGMPLLPLDSRLHRAAGIRAAVHVVGGL